MLRDKLNEAMKDAMRARDTAALGTIRLILAKLKEVDIAARTEASREGVPDDRLDRLTAGGGEVGHRVALESNRSGFRCRRG